jgi:uncharacterized protein
MLLRPLFLGLLLFALLGDARVFLFVVNRVVFGAHKEEKNPFNWLLYVLPPLLVVLTGLFWPLGRWIDHILGNRYISRVTPEAIEELATTERLARIGAVWMIVAAAIGIYWILDRFRMNYLVDHSTPGTLTLAPDVIPLRNAHIPFAALRKLGAHNDLYDIEVTHHEVMIGDLPPSFDGYRIAFLTDTHVAAFMRRGFYRECVERVRRFDPDLVLLGGDFVTWKRHIPLMAEVLLTGLEAKDGVFAVLGNHDYWAGSEQVRSAMSARGVQFIINHSVELRRNGDVMHLAGIDEIYRGEPDVDAAFAAVDPSRPCIGLSHHPDIIDYLDGRRFDLLVCGHTHGGQIRLPFFGAIVVPSVHESRYASGFQRVGKVLLYVSRGLGSVPPLRILCRPEVATFVFRKS